MNKEQLFAFFEQQDSPFLLQVLHASYDAMTVDQREAVFGESISAGRTADCGWPVAAGAGQAVRRRLPGRRVSTGMINTILDACQEVLEINGDAQSAYWLASQMMEMRLWRASEHVVRAALDQDIDEKGEQSLFVKVADDEYALRSWAKS